MDYIKQLNAFWKWREMNDISHTQIDLYFALLDTFNRAFWVPVLSIPNRTIMSKAEISDKKQLVSERSGLMSFGLITYEPGDRKKAGTYTIIPLYSTEESADTTPEITPKITPQFTQDLPKNLPPINKTENIKQKTKTKTDIYGERAEIQEVFDAYNNICKSLPKAEKLTAKRKTQITARLKTYGIERIKEAFVKAELSDFLRGLRGDWKANFDWFMGNNGNILKVIEGNYDNNTTPRITPEFTPKITPQNDPQFTALSETENVDEIERQFMSNYGG